MGEELLRIRAEDEAVDAFKRLDKVLRDAGENIKTLTTITRELDKAGQLINVSFQGLTKTSQTFIGSIKNLNSEEERLRVKLRETNLETNKQAEAIREAKRESEAFRARIQKGFTAKDLDIAGASLTQKLNLKQAESAILRLIRNMEVTKTRAMQIFNDVRNGIIKAYQGGSAAAQREIVRLVKAQEAIGRTANHELNDVDKALKNSSNNVREFTLSWQSLKRIVEIQILRRAVFALSNAIRNAIDTAKEFSKAIAEVRTISQNAQLLTEEWSKGLIRLSNAFGLDVLDVAEAAYQTLSNQVAEGARVFSFLEDTIKFGITTQTSATDSVQLLTAAINAYGLEAKDAEEVASTFFKTIELGRVRASELANSFGRIGILGAQLGIQLEELQAAITALTIRGLKFSEVSTQIRGILLKLVKPTEEMKRLLQDLGVESGEAAIEVFGLQGFLRILATRTEGSTTELGKIVSRIRGLVGAVGLTNDGLNTFNENFREIQESSESYAAAVEEAFNSTGRSIDRIIQEIKNLILEDFGQTLAESIVFVDKNFASITSIVRGLIASLEAFATITIARLVIPKIGALVLALGRLPQTLSGISFSLKSTERSLLGFINSAVTVSIVIGKTLEVAFDSWADSINRAREAAEEFQTTLRKTAERNIERSTIFIDKIIDQVEVAYSDVAGKAAKALKKIRDELELQEELVKESTKIFEDSYEDALKTIEESIKDITDRQKEAFKDISQLGGFLKTFKKDIEDTLFERELELAPNLENQFRIIERRISDFNERLNQAAQENNVELVKELFNQLRELQTQLDEVDREAIERRRELQREIQELNKDAEEERLDLALKINEEIEKGNIERANNLKQKQIDNLLELRDKQLKLNRELEKLQSERAGTFADRFESDLIQLLKKAEEEVSGIQYRLTEEALKLEDEKAKKQFRNALLIAEVEEIRRTRPDEAFFKKDAEEINKLFSKRRELINQTVRNLRELDAEQAATRLEEQLANEKKQISIELQAKRTREINKAIAEQLKATKESAEIVKEILQIDQRRVERTRVLSAEFLDQNDILKSIREQFAREKFKDEFRGLSGILNVDDRRFRDLEFSRLKDTFERLETSLQEFIKTGEGVSNIVDLITIILNKSRELDIELTDTERLYLQNIKMLIEGREETVKGVNEILNQREDVRKLLTDALGTTDLFASRLEETSDEATKEILKLNEAVNRLRNNLINTANAIPRLSEKVSKITNTPITEPLPFAHGGKVNSIDNIPALLSPGEYVINAKSARKFYSQLVGINAARFANGGSVKGGATFNGDFNVSLQSSGKETVDVVRIAKLLRREIRRGRVVL